MIVLGIKINRKRLVEKEKEREAACIYKFVRLMKQGHERNERTQESVPMWRGYPWTREEKKLKQKRRN